MAPPSTPTEPPERSSSSTNTPTATPSPIPPPVPVETHPNRIRPSFQLPQSPDPTRLAPEDALTPPRLRPIASLDGSVVSSSSAAARAAAAALRPAVASLRKPPAIPPVAARLEQERRAARAARKRHKPHVWKKLLWIKQRGYPDNYTDPATFLEHLQRNPKLRPYDFWPLVADSMVIVQHVCSMVVFVSAYAGIYQDRLSPVAVVVCGTIATLVGWLMWDQWKCEEESAVESGAETTHAPAMNGHAYKSVPPPLDDKASTSSSNGSGRLPTMNGNGHVNGYANGATKKGLGLSLSTSNLAAKNAEQQSQSQHGPSLSRSSLISISPIEPLAERDSMPNLDDIHHRHQANGTASTRGFSHKSNPSTASHKYIPQSPTTLPSTVSPRNQARLKTFKSALLIYFALLGLSPILKSLTKSTSSDSIWALATWLLIINIFFFDYGSQYVPSSISSRSASTSATPPATVHAKGTLHAKASQASFATSATAPSRAPLAQVDTTTSMAPLAPVTSPTPATNTLPPQNTYPSSLSTNAAVMASTVLASRLPTTTSVFSLTLFSIQLFGLFPLFRRHLRSRSFPLHTALTIALVLMASAGLGLILSQSYTHTYGDCGFCLSWVVHVFARSMVGILVGGTGTVVVMGGCAWWLISLQRYKNVVIGPWDPARPMLAGGGRVGDGG
ncbi:glycosylphosphatidylinositol anchor biosynthesis [Exophiala xenobiotica]|uniref:Glycosylphosphatidylinositol anchor biosynthesis n=1 Tax=Lithohypha guttulata TaxID=1690604 RepID=A0ABR0KFJ3_9EURO|nr:glycosylphosphatidylinositol anchor biosynthesis [Lithohypha guttulata]KAK5322881.1 glycosylphosphatidylinositol anchor biosynthesis [Exophiala xenobiotica]